MQKKMPTAHLSEFYDFLRKKGITASNVYQKLEAWTPTQILDFALDAYLHLLSPVRDNASFYNFAANSTLSGAPFPCSAMQCRLREIDSLARFSSLYADVVYIKNPFAKYINETTVGIFTRETIAGDIVIMLYLRPLFRAGLLAIRSNLFLLCKECEAEIEAIEEQTANSIQSARRKLSNYLKRHYFGSESRNHLKTQIGSTMAVGSETGGSDGQAQTHTAHVVGSSG